MASSNYKKKKKPIKSTSKLSKYTPKKRSKKAKAKKRKLIIIVSIVLAIILALSVILIVNNCSKGVKFDREGHFESGAKIAHELTIKEEFEDKILKSCKCGYEKWDLKGSRNYSIYDGNGIYGKTELAKEKNGSKLVALYDEFYIESNKYLKSKVDLEFSPIQNKNNLTADEIRLVFSVFIYENPTFYFLENSWLSTTESGKTNPSTITLTACAEYDTVEERVVVEIALQQKLDEVYSLVKGKNLPLDKAKAIHDYLLDNLTYADEAAKTGLFSCNSSKKNNWAFCLDGLATKNRAVCEGYAKSFLYFSNIFGVETTICTGEGKTNSGSEPHAWNLIKINGSWYGVDATWDDSFAESKDAKTDYTFFGKGTSFSADHVSDSFYKKAFTLANINLI
ncbi:MAG: hypothetical protein IJW43_00990 [Clostridia bacterium]|nr:hypothetical protein [Clostridia bacterium]